MGEQTVLVLMASIIPFSVAHVVMDWVVLALVVSITPSSVEAVTHFLYSRRCLAQKTSLALLRKVSGHSMLAKTQSSGMPFEFRERLLLKRRRTAFVEFSRTWRMILH